MWLSGHGVCSFVCLLVFPTKKKTANHIGASLLFDSLAMGSAVFLFFGCVFLILIGESNKFGPMFHVQQTLYFVLFFVVSLYVIRWWRTMGLVTGRWLVGRPRGGEGWCSRRRAKGRLRTAQPFVCRWKGCFWWDNKPWTRQGAGSAGAFVNYPDTPCKVFVTPTYPWNNPNVNLSYMESWNAWDICIAIPTQTGLELVSMSTLLAGIRKHMS